MTKVKVGTLVRITEFYPSGKEGGDASVASEKEPIWAVVVKPMSYTNRDYYAKYLGGGKDEEFTRFLGTEDARDFELYVDRDDEYEIIDGDELPDEALIAVAKYKLLNGD